jgi:hypothetical protein
VPTQVSQVLPATNVTLLIGLIAVIFGVIQVLALAGMTGWMQAKKDARDAVNAIAAAKTAAQLKSDEKAEDWRRQDELADRVAKQAANVATQAAAAATLLLNAQKDTIARTDEVARQRVLSEKHVNEQLAIIQHGNEKIHTLVNSDMTAARTAERDAVKVTLIALKKVRALSIKLELPELPEEAEAIAAAEARITELDQILADRLAAQIAIDHAAAAAAAAARTEEK